MVEKIELTKAERKIDLFVNANSEKVGYMSVRVLAAEIGVSTASILRYIHKLSFPSYKAFQLHLKEQKYRKLSLILLMR